MLTDETVMLVTKEREGAHIKLRKKQEEASKAENLSIYSHATQIKKSYIMNRNCDTSRR